MTDRFRDTAAIWNWLPAFRAVAETEHLPSAGQMMGVTPPALSRSVKNLEDALQRELFARTGRNIRLNDDGERLVQAVRLAMRTVHDALEELRGEAYRGTFRWTATWSLSRLVVDVLQQMAQDHPQWVPQMFPINADDCVGQLQRGELDLVVLTGRVDVPGLALSELGVLPHSVFCGPSHTLAGADEVGWKEMAEHPFAAPIADAKGTFGDGWPAQKPRRVTMQFAQMEVGYQACLAGHVLAVLPDHVAAGLHKLRSIRNAPMAYAVHRATITAGPPEEVVEGLQALMAHA